MFIAPDSNQHLTLSHHFLLKSKTIEQQGLGLCVWFILRSPVPYLTQKGQMLTAFGPESESKAF